MGHPLKSISPACIPDALAKAEHYRYLNEPEEAESICRDILAVDALHQLANRVLGLSLVDQFIGASSDRHAEALGIFEALHDPYERVYYAGLLHERRAKTQLLVGYPPHTLLPLLEEAMRCFAEAEKIRPAGNDESILRWNRCVRLLESRDDFYVEDEPEVLDSEDLPTDNAESRRAGGLH